MFQCLGFSKKKDVTRIASKIRTAVWVHYHGHSLYGQCYCCGVAILNYEPWHCAHVKARVHGGKLTVDNLRTCCAHCNLSMGNQNLYAFIQNHNLQGPGAAHTRKYLKRHRSQRLSRRTNNYGRN